MKKLSIIIVSYNTKQLLDECIASIYSSKINHSYEIIVVDNNSADESVLMLESRYPEVKIIKNNSNNLFAIANNQGAQIAEGEYILLLNSDTIVYDDNIEKLINFMDNQSPDIICIGPKILNKDKTLQSQGMCDITHWSTFTHHFKLARILPSVIGKRILPIGTYSFNKDIPHEVGWCSGSCMLLRKKEYLKIGGLNENLEFYGEEPEFSYRARKKGFKTIYYPDANIIHLGGASTSKTVNNEKQQQDSIRRYSLIVQETVGYKYAIGTSQITKLAYCLKYIFSKNKTLLKDQIRHETKIIKHFRNHLKAINN